MAVVVSPARYRSMICPTGRSSRSYRRASAPHRSSTPARLSRLWTAELDRPAAAAIARWTRQGRQLCYVIATAGEAGIEGMAPDVAGPLRQDEERRSAAVVFGLSSTTLTIRSSGRQAKHTGTRCGVARASAVAR